MREHLVSSLALKKWHWMIKEICLNLQVIELLFSMNLSSDKKY